MRLTSVSIRNFRSIAEAKIDFNSYRTVSLVGVNEAGKSNILRALSLVSETFTVSPNDIRVPRPDEPQIEEAYVSFNFEFSQSNIAEAIQLLEKRTLSAGNDLPSFVGKKGLLTFKEFAAARTAIELRIDLLSGTDSYWTQDLDKDYPEVENGWLYVKESTEAVIVPWNAEYASLDGIALARLSHVDIDSATRLDAEQLDAEWDNVLGEVANQHLPTVLFWTYEKENVLPNSVSLDEFIEDPSICVPLKCIFEMADVFNISETLKNEELRGRQRLNNLLTRIGLRASNHFKSVWKNYKPAFIDLQLDGTEIRISVRDENISFNFEERSEGFKRFMTFLIMVSAKSKTNELENTLLLVDEPEASLHPSGIRSLRDELLRIGQKSYIAYATHSPHMIDSANVSRHMIVRKTGEITECSVAHAEKLFDDEVLLNSLGTSLFEALKPTNLVFEGWRDKRLFEVYRASAPAELNRSFIEKCGTCFTQGVKDIKNIIPILMLAERHAVIVTDHDDPALDARKAYVAAGMHDPWRTYRELEGKTSQATTAEDFLKPGVLCTAFEILCSTRKLTGNLQPEDLSGDARLETIKRYANACGIKNNDLKIFIDELKSLVFNELKFEHIDDRYKFVYQSLCSTVESLAPNKPKTHLTIAASH